MSYVSCLMSHVLSECALVEVLPVTDISLIVSNKYMPDLEVIPDNKLVFAVTAGSFYQNGTHDLAIKF